jgi:hypothetical protein
MPSYNSCLNLMLMIVSMAQLARRSVSSCRYELCTLQIHKLPYADGFSLVTILISFILVSVWQTAPKYALRLSASQSFDSLDSTATSVDTDVAIGGFVRSLGIFVAF